MSTLDHKLEPEVTTVRRLEVITGTGCRMNRGQRACIIGEWLQTETRQCPLDRKCDEVIAIPAKSHQPFRTLYIRGQLKSLTAGRRPTPRLLFPLA